ncbi:MAG: IS5 family transposase, partial [Verrucomicrobiales bacterium]
MRKRFDLQIELGQPSIESVIIPLNSRDELPPIIAGLQWIFKTPEINEQIFALLERQIVGDKQDTGRPGMDLWHILVLG